MGREYEIKTVFDPSALPALSAHPLLAEALGTDAAVRTASTYYDTEDLDLWRAGFSLRLRTRDDVITQTLKQAGTGSLERGEWEWPL